MTDTKGGGPESTDQPVVPDEGLSDGMFFVWPVRSWRQPVP